MSSERTSLKSRSHLPVQHNSPTNPDDDDAVNQMSGSSANAQNAQPSPSNPSASSSRHKFGDVTTAPTVLPFSLSLTLKNTGSVARDHLASERTFLAYVRTSLSFASAGVGASPTTFDAITFELITCSALVQLFRVSVSTSALNNTAAQYARPLGATLIGLGIAVLGMGKLVFPHRSEFWSLA
jgi:uncharacterized membrane protein YidH (DUF202 family)